MPRTTKTPAAPKTAAKATARKATTKTAAKAPAPKVTARKPKAPAAPAPKASTWVRQSTVSPGEGVAASRFTTQPQRKALREMAIGEYVPSGGPRTGAMLARLAELGYVALSARGGEPKLTKAGRAFVAANPAPKTRAAKTAAPAKAPAKAKATKAPAKTAAKPKAKATAKAPAKRETAVERRARLGRESVAANA